MDEKKKNKTAHSGRSSFSFLPMFFHNKKPGLAIKMLSAKHNCFASSISLLVRYLNEAWLENSPGLFCSVFVFVSRGPRVETSTQAKRTTLQNPYSLSMD